MQNYCLLALDVGTPKCVTLDLSRSVGGAAFLPEASGGDLLAPVQPLGAVFVPRHGAPSLTSGPSGAASVGVCLALALALALTSALVTPSPPLTRLSPLPPSDEAPVITWRLLH